MTTIAFDGERFAANAIKAVEIASKLDAHTGGGLTVIMLECGSIPSS